MVSHSHSHFPIGGDKNQGLQYSWIISPTFRRYSFEKFSVQVDIHLSYLENSVSIVEIKLHSLARFVIQKSQKDRPPLYQFKVSLSL